VEGYGVVDEDEVVEGRAADDEPGEEMGTIEVEPAAVVGGRLVVATGADVGTGGGDEATTRDDELTTVGVGEGGLGAPEAGGDAAGGDAAGGDPAGP
jgi:hypothetical protein